MAERALPSHSERRPRHWNYTEAGVPDFAGFTEAFCAGWNAHRREGDVHQQRFTQLLKDAFESSGAMLAHKVAAGAMTEDEARHVLAERAALAYVEDLAAEHKRQTNDG